MKAIFTTTVVKDTEVNATGLTVPLETVTALGSHKRPPVKVTLGGYTYRSTIAAYGDVFMLPLSAENREAAGVKAGDEVEVTLELDLEPRTLEIPPDLATALDEKTGAAAAFARLALSMRKEYVRQVVTAKAQATRERRIAAIVAKLAG
jgi:hypothetical protein